MKSYTCVQHHQFSTVKVNKTLEIVKQDKCPKYSGSSIYLCPTHYCVKQNIVFTLAFSIQYTCIYI